MRGLILQHTAQWLEENQTGLDITSLFFPSIPQRGCYCLSLITNGIGEGSSIGQPLGPSQLYHYFFS